MSITAFPVSARILTERNLLNSRSGTIAISCAAVDDVAAWCLVALLMAASATGWLLVVAGLAAYGAVMVFALRPLLRRCVPNMAGALVLLIASSWSTAALGVHALLGAFVAGACDAAGHGIAEGLRTSIALVSGVKV